MHRALLTALFLSVSFPAIAQEEASAPAMSAEQVTAFNNAVTDFTAGQQAQQSGDNATALAKYEAALPAIREAVRVQPENMDMVGFLANALYATAAANAGLQKMDAFAALFEESLPYWRKMASAKPDDVPTNTALAGILTQLGNVKMSRQNKPDATPLYAEALPIARKVANEKPDAASKNLLFSTLVTYRVSRSESVASGVLNGPRCGSRPADQTM